VPSFGPAFDKNAFDVGAFDALYATPLLFKVSISRENRKVALGEAVEVSIELHAVTSDGKRTGLNTANPPTINIYKPDYTLLVTAVNMYNSGRVGVYGYQHQVLTTDGKGSYTASFKVINGDRTMQSDQMVIFEVI